MLKMSKKKTAKLLNWFVIILFFFLLQLNISYAVNINGKIIEEKIDPNGNAYTILRVWGTYYEMGYAHGFFFAEEIDNLIETLKQQIGEIYNPLKAYMQNTSIPEDVKEELDGMVAGVKSKISISGIDSGDLLVLNTAVDWIDGLACRSHSCWGSYVTEPVKTLSTRRADYATESVDHLFSNLHWIIQVYEPSDEAKDNWINFTAPGLISAATALNEYGTIVSIHDSPMNDVISDINPNVLTRSLGTRKLIAPDNYLAISRSNLIMFTILSRVTIH